MLPPWQFLSTFEVCLVYRASLLIGALFCHLVYCVAPTGETRFRFSFSFSFSSFSGSTVRLAMEKVPTLSADSFSVSWSSARVSIWPGQTGCFVARATRAKSFRIAQQISYPSLSVGVTVSLDSQIKKTTMYYAMAVRKLDSSYLASGSTSCFQHISGYSLGFFSWLGHAIQRNAQ